MDLEKRVQVLEKEVHILKGEIQALLLDMQDYLLNQTHPELRGITPQTQQQYREDDATQPNPPNSLRYEAAEADVPATIEVETEPAPPAKAKDKNGWIPYHKLEAWTLQKLREQGVPYTRKAVDHHAMQGKFDPEYYDSIMQFIDLYELKLQSQREATVPSKAAVTQSSRSKLSHKAKQPKSHSNDGESNLILRLIAGVQNAGIGITRRDDG